MDKGSNVYFISDLHLGLPTRMDPLEREKLVVRWMEEVRPHASALYVVGDIFDYWFEYKYVIPKGFSRFLGKVAEFTDAGIEVHFFTGNHDVWMFDYFPRELGVRVHREPLVTEILGKRFYIAHGDGLGPGDRGYKFLKKIFTHPVLQWLYARLHPNFATWLAHRWSRSRRDPERGEEGVDGAFLGEDKEKLLLYARELVKREHYDYLVFGHRHLPIDFLLPDRTRVIVLGDWLEHFSYAVYDGREMVLTQYEPPEQPAGNGSS